MAEQEQQQRRTFGPVVLAGLAGSALAAWAGSRSWISLSVTDGQLMNAEPSSSSPAATSLALVALASWGVLLVTRGLVRRLVAVLAALASLGTGLTLIGLGSLEEQVGHDAVTTGGTVSTGYTVWPWLTLLGAVVALVAALAALWFVPGWPEMGRRYDAPGSQNGHQNGQSQATADEAETPRLSGDDAEEPSNLDLWNAIGEGRDPTSEPTSDPTRDQPQQRD